MTFDRVEEDPPRRRHALIEIGSHTLLHRRRVIAEGAYAIEGGLVTDMGSMLSLSYHDPDGCWREVMWVKPGAPFNAGIVPPAEWQMIDLD